MSGSSRAVWRPRKQSAAPLLIMALILIAPIAQAQVTANALGTSWTRVTVPTAPGEPFLEDIVIGDTLGVVFSEGANVITFARLNGTTFDTYEVRPSGTPFNAFIGADYIGPNEWVVTWRESTTTTVTAYSTDNGFTWNLTSDPSSAIVAADYVFRAVSNDTFWYTQNNDVAYTEDAGVSWTVLFNCASGVTGAVIVGSPGVGWDSYGIRTADGLPAYKSVSADCSTELDVDSGTPGTQTYCLLDVPNQVGPGFQYDFAIAANTVYFAWNNETTDEERLIYSHPVGQWNPIDCSTTNQATPLARVLIPSAAGDPIALPWLHGTDTYGSFGYYNAGGTASAWYVIAGGVVNGPVNSITTSNFFGSAANATEAYIITKDSEDLFVWISDELPTAGGGPLVGTPTQGPFEVAKQFFVDSWGVDEDVGNWLFGLATVLLILFAALKWTDSTIVLGVVALLAIGVAIALGFLPVYLILVVIFLIIAVAGQRMFEAGDGDGD